MRSNAGASDQLPLRASSSNVPTKNRCEPVNPPARTAAASPAWSGSARRERAIGSRIFTRIDTAWRRAASLLLALQHHGHADSARGAHRHQAVLLLRALQLVAHGGHDARAGGAEGMSQRDGAAGEVDLFRIDVA